ncbi:contact-dependent growth inhibition system immunity protein [Aureibaculum sp. 2210JD6-5]|uniref:contact-dependent growth inhibition system immunity protein n=1 Tax=Aureibaculum sp. 2210JD6-5 TaxID=3103957 RepID=UPI002AAC5B06|nr:contact-dependent growth inhibition system immunity protein [Aureibaculum sp. 2210JD6-5]MDY7393910.1 contact-dependent growth inhibition system immunity protein [Aureibaculum sp. 2210JD6-5]
MKSKTHLSLEQLENEVWSKPNYDSNLVVKCHELRKKAVRDFSIEDLRLMIGQEIGLKYLMPLAIEELEKNILAEGDLYEGDLLANVLGEQTKKYWRNNNSAWKNIVKLIHLSKDKFSERDYEKIQNKITLINA